MESHRALDYSPAAFLRQSYPPFELDPSTLVENFCSLAAYLERIVTILRNFHYIWK
jgi:hypothetical protein